MQTQIFDSAGSDADSVLISFYYQLDLTEGSLGKGALNEQLYRQADFGMSGVVVRDC